MTDLFLKIVNMSISATWLVLAVVALRFALKKAPKWVSVFLWGLVAVRLLCPFTLESALSLIPSSETISPEIMMDPSPEIHTGIEAVNSVVNPIITESFTPNPAASANPLQIWIPVAAAVWCTGMVLMLAYTVFTYLRLRRRVRMAVRVKENIYLSEYVSSPFVLGIVKPRIYLPYHMSEQDAAHVIAHERTHIRRKDHWWKPLGFLLLTLHWFNPVMWLAYILLCRDIELACDEKVVRDMDAEQRAGYSQALLDCSVNHRMIAACPLAFGEVGVRQRVKNVLNYKKPAFWIILAAILAVIVLAVCFMTDPISDPSALLQRVMDQDGYRITQQEPVSMNIMFYKHWLPDDILTREGHTFKEKEIVLYETETSALYISRAGLDENGEYVVFDFAFSYALPECGTIVMPYEMVESEHTGKPEGIWFSAALASGDVMDSTTNHVDGAKTDVFSSTGSDLSLYIKKDVYEAATDFVAVEFTGMNRLSYIPDDTALGQLLDKQLRVEQVVYEHPALSSIVTPETAPFYTFSADFTLMTMEQQAVVPMLNGWKTIGTMTHTELTEENFDGCFVNVPSTSFGWTADLTPAKLRRENETAWVCVDENTALDSSYYLLQQKNGDVYLVRMRAETGIAGRVFKLTEDGAAMSSAGIAKVYTYHAEDALQDPSIVLRSDGTFRMNTNILSSYAYLGRYTLTEEALELHTDDGLYSFYFTPTAEGFAFDAWKSAGIEFLAEDMKTARPVPNGGIFQAASGEEQAGGGEVLINACAEAINSRDTDSYMALFTGDNQREMLDYLSQNGEENFFRERNVEITRIRKLSDQEGKASSGVTDGEIAGYSDFDVYYTEMTVEFTDGSAEAQKNNFVMVKEDGNWKILRIATPNMDFISEAVETTPAPESPYTLTSTLRAETFQWAEVVLNGEEEERHYLTREKRSVLVAILNHLDEEAFQETSGIQFVAIQSNAKIVLQSHEDVVALYSDGEQVELHLDLSYAESMRNGAWVVRDEALNAYFAELCNLDDLITPLCGSVYQVTEILYDDPNHAETDSIGVDAPAYAISDEGHLLEKGDILSDGEWTDKGKFGSAELTSLNFDPYFKNDPDADPIRGNVQQAWYLYTYNETGDVHYYLIRQKSGELYLAFVRPNLGYSEVRWLVKLEPAE